MKRSGTPGIGKENPKPLNRGDGYCPRQRIRALVLGTHSIAPPGLKRLDLKIPELAALAPGYIPAHPAGC